MSLIKNISYSLAAFVFSKPLGFILTFLLAKSLGPADFGIWVTLMLVVAYSPIACLGTVETLLKQVPYYRGRHELSRAHDVESSVMGSIILASVTVSGAAMIAVIFCPSFVFGIRSSSIALMVVTSAISYFSGYFYNRFAAYENFKAVGMIDFTRAILALLFAGGLGWLWGLRGAIIGYMLHELFVCIVSGRISVRSSGKVGVSFNSVLLIQAIRVGFPITLLWWTLVLSATVDRLVLGSMLGAISVGLYGLAISLTNTLALMPLVLGRVLYPKVNKQFGQDLGTEPMKRIVLAPTLAMGTLLANLQLILLVAMPFLYNQVVPKYQSGLLAGQILVLGSFFSCLLRNGANYLIAANQERLFLKYIVTTLLFNIVSDVGFVKLGLGIEGVAIGTSLAGLLLTSLVWRRVLNGLGFERYHAWLTLFKLYLPAIAAMAVAVCLRLAYHPAFKIFNLTAILLGIALCISLNAVLYCFPLYRNEIHTWVTHFSNFRAAAVRSVTLSRSSASNSGTNFRKEGL